jgi:tripartite-type tricarboxylate transporter receptor subunit TctC
MSRFGSVARLIFVTITVAATSGAFGQAYPTKPLRLIVSSAPGGGTDTIARILAASLSASLGQQSATWKKVIEASGITAK